MAEVHQRRSTATPKDAADDGEGSNSEPAAVGPSSDAAERILHGFFLAVDGIKLALQQPRCRRMMLSYALGLGGALLVLYIVLSYLLLPLNLLVTVLAWLLPGGADDKTQPLTRASEGITWFKTAALAHVPLLTLFLQKYVDYARLDELYLAVATDTHPSLAASLAKRQRVPLSVLAREFLVRFAKSLAALAVVSILSLIPVVGFLVVPLLALLNTVKTFGWRWGIAISALLLLPFARVHVKTLVAWYLSTRALGREIMDPYFSRVKLSSSERRKLFAKLEPTITAFTLPFSIALAFSWSTPFFFALAQAAAARFLPELTTEEILRDAPGY